MTVLFSLSSTLKFSRSPSKFLITSSPEDEVNDKNDSKLDENSGNKQKKIFIAYDFPWGRENIEEIVNAGNSYSKNMNKDRQKVSLFFLS